MIVIIWLIVFFVMLGVLLLVCKFGLYWVEIFGYVREWMFGCGEWFWESWFVGMFDCSGESEGEGWFGVLICIFFVVLFIVLVLVMVGVIVYVMLCSVEEVVNKLVMWLY